MKRDVKLFIEDIKENIMNIEDFSKGITFNEFKKDKLRQNAIMRCLEIIGEATKNVPEDFRKKYPNIPWKDISGFRDKISHGYFGVDLERIWNIIDIDLSTLKREIMKIKF